MAPALGRIGVFSAGFEGLAPDRLAEVARELEQLGYGTVWIPEGVGDSLVTSSLLLSATSTLIVGTAITSIWSRDPLCMTGGQRRLGSAFPDRFVLGLGVSHEPMVSGVRKQPYRAPLTRMRSYLEDMDEASENVRQMVMAAGLPQGVGDVDDEVRPLRVLAALGPKMLELASTHADGAVPYLQTPAHTDFARQLLGPDAIVAPTQMVIPERDATAARARARWVMALYLTLPNYVNNLRRLGFDDDDLSDTGSDRLIDAIFAWGSHESIARRVAEQFDAGADHVAVQVVKNTFHDLADTEWRELAPALLG